MNRDSSRAAAEFHEVFVAQFDWVRHAVRRRGVREADVEDVALDVLVTFHRRLGDFDPTRSVRAWLGGIVKRMASDHRQRAHVRREQLVDVSGESDELGEPADDWLEREETRALVQRALTHVHEARRPILVLHDVEGWTMPAIAESLGLPLNTAYSRLRLARAELRAAVEKVRRDEQNP